MPAATTVRTFLEALQDADLDAALPLLADDARWVNVSLPEVRGRRAIERILRSGYDRGGGFRVHFFSIAAAGDVVLTERCDAITLGRFEQRFWVYGRFELDADGRIAVWRDSFDWADLLTGLLRGVAGLAHPALNRGWPLGR